MRKREPTLSFMEMKSCICSENAIQLQSSTACIGIVQCMEIDTVGFNRSTVPGGTATSAKQSGDEKERRRHSFIEMLSWNFPRKATRISALFNLHVRVVQQKYIRGFPRKPRVRVVRRWGQSRKEKKRESPEFHGRPVVLLLWKFYFVAAYHCEHRGKVNSWRSK